MNQLFFSLTIFSSFFVFIFAVPESFKNLTPRNENGGLNWAVLVAGSNTWGNYRHQADICHAYQILHQNGFSDDQVIVMMYDDIAYNFQNPYPGVIWNQEGGPDVYHGVPHDYTGDNVNAENFFSVLQGITPTNGSGKTVKSTQDDNIFVFYSDHGATGLICMPTGPWVYTWDLVPILQKMSDDQRFNKFLFYLEACESGSMFYPLLPSDISIFATTASTPTESSWACIYSSTMYAYLGDCYSINWMNYTEQNKVSDVTVEDEFLWVRDATAMSTCCTYGDSTLANDKLSVYLQGTTQQTTSSQSSPLTSLGTPIDQRHVEEGLLKERFLRATTKEETMKLAQEMEELTKFRVAEASFFYKLGVETLGDKYQEKLKPFLAFYSKVNEQRSSPQYDPSANCYGLYEDTQRLVFQNAQCYKTVTEMVRETCGPLDAYSLRFTPVFASLCHLTGADLEAVRLAINSLCPEPFWH